MKTTKKLFGTLLLVIITQFAFADKNIKSNQSDIVKLRKHLISQIAFPSEIKNVSGKEATVFFEINKDLKPEICEVESAYPEIEKFIRAEFENMQLPAEYAKINERYGIKIKFNQNN